MNYFKPFALTLIFTLLTTQFSFAKTLDDPNSDLRNYVTKLLNKPQLDRTINEEVRISFFVTTDKELVVLKTDARTNVLDEFIKERMNYKKIDINNLEANRIFHIKIHFNLGK